MAESAFDEAEIELLHDDLSGPCNSMCSINPPPKTPEPLGQWIPQKLDQIEFWWAGWEGEKQYFKGLSIIFYPTGLALVVLLGIMKKEEVPKKYLFVTDSVELHVRSNFLHKVR